MVQSLQEYMDSTQGKINALQKFKDFVHKRLDDMGIPTHPDGPHSKEGCRIGDRLDIVQDKILPKQDEHLTTRSHRAAMEYYPIINRSDTELYCYNQNVFSKGYVVGALQESKLHQPTVIQLISLQDKCVAYEKELEQKDELLRRLQDPQHPKFRQ